MRFEDTNLIPELLKAVSDAGYETPTRIQEDTIPLALMGRDVLGCAQTGTGKTAAFALPILQRLYRGERTLYGGRVAGTKEAPKKVFGAPEKPAAVVDTSDVQYAKTMDEAYGKTVSAPSKSAQKKEEESAAGGNAKSGAEAGGKSGGKKSKKSKKAEEIADGRVIRALILTPTRELALQIEENIEQYGSHLPLRSVVVFGGVSQVPQVEKLQKGVDILVATPGRLNDLIGQGYIRLDDLEIFVLDEADRMLDMGFLPDVRKVMAKLPKVRQTLFFSATMPPEVEKLALELLYEPITVKVNPPTSTVDAIRQTVYFVDKANKRKLLADLINAPGVWSALVFVRTKHGADRVARDLARAGIPSASIHGDKSQGARQSALKNFKDGKIKALVATDIAARGIDISELSHVFNYDIPNEPETYIHRIGRTGRAGLGGDAISFCCYDEFEEFRAIEKLINKQIPETPSPYPMEVFTSTGNGAGGRPPRTQQSGKNGSRSGSGSNGRNGKRERSDNVKKYGKERPERHFPKEEWFDPEDEKIVLEVVDEEPEKNDAAKQPGKKSNKRRRRKKKPATTAAAPAVTPEADSAMPEAASAAKKETKKAEKNAAQKTAPGADSAAKKETKKTTKNEAKKANPEQNSKQNPKKNPKADTAPKAELKQEKKQTKKPEKAFEPENKKSLKPESKKNSGPERRERTKVERHPETWALPKKQEPVPDIPDDDFMPEIVFKKKPEGAEKKRFNIFGNLVKEKPAKEPDNDSKPTEELNHELVADEKTRSWLGSRGQRPQVVDRRNADEDN